MTKTDDFYRLRDRRTVQLGGDPRAFERTVAYRAGPATASSSTGQVLLLALLNMAARVHRRIIVDVPDSDLVAPAIVPATSLHEAITQTVLAIDPYCHIEIGEPSEDAVVVVGIGDELDGCSWYLGANCYRATLSDRPVAVTADPSSVYGAALASCMGAAAAYYQVHGHALTPSQLSLWDLTGGDGAPLGTGGLDAIDVGAVAAVGAGAVGTALTYWVGNVGVRGDWQIIDHDVVELHNTNRSLLFLPAHAGWPDGDPVFKAHIAASFIGATPRTETYADWTKRGTSPDLVLPLANADGVRQVIGQRGEPILLHATTSRDSTAELHRHRPEMDQCIGCRFPDDRAPDLACSTGPALDAVDESEDAALPFLSAAAGLLLARTLAQLPDGPQLEANANHWRLGFAPNGPFVQTIRWSCDEACAHTVPGPARRAGHQLSKWTELDPG